MLLSGRFLTRMCLLGVFAVSACTDEPPLSSPDDRHFSYLQSEEEVEWSTPKGDLVTTNVAAFATQLEKIGNELEVIVWLKSEFDAPPRAEAFSRPLSPRPELVALPKRPLNKPYRMALTEFRASKRWSDDVLALLRQSGGQPQHVGDAIPFISVRLPKAGATATIAALLRHPNVDYVSANRRIRVTMQSGITASVVPPEGTNGMGTQHTLLNVDDVWAYTRGSAGKTAKIGVMDHGLARDDFNGVFHGDAVNLGNYGVIALGFVDDLLPGGMCYTNGGCDPYDDQWLPDGRQAHGTKMVGIAGANDNNRGIVGIAPRARVYSLKAIFNDEVHGSCGSGVGGDGRSCLEDDDFIEAWNWASANRLDAVSMSFMAPWLGTDAQRAVDTAFRIYDVLPLAGTGNLPTQNWAAPASWPNVLGIGGVDHTGASMFNTGNRDLAAFADFGTSLSANCSSTAICDAGNPETVFFQFGTSGATAAALGVVALLRSYYPMENATQISNRLTSTRQGANFVIDALAALGVSGAPKAYIQGPSSVTAGQQATWTAYVAAGTAPFTYTWSRDWSPVGSGTTYSETVQGPSFNITLEVRDALNRLTVYDHWVTVN